MRPLIVAALLAILLTTGLLRAEPPPLRLAAELEQPSTVISGAELRTYGNTFYELEEALAAREGITFLSAGDVGSEDWILVRGFPRDSSRNVLVLLDGMPINNAAYEGVEAHDLPASQIDRVEVYRPPLPARFGGYHAVLAFYTRPRRSDVGLEAGAMAAMGSLAIQRAEVWGSQRHGPLSVDVSLATLSTDALSGRLRTPPFENLRYQDRSYWDFAPTIRTNYRPSANTELASSILFSNGQKWFSDDEFRNRRFVLAGVTAAHRATDSLSFRATAHAGYERYFLRLRMHPDVGLQFRHRLGTRLETIVQPTSYSTTFIGVEANERGLDEHARLSALQTFGAFAEQRLAPIPRVNLGAGVRASGFRLVLPEASGGFNSGIGWSASAAVQPWLGTVVSSRIGQNLRDPALGELTSNKHMRSERLWGGELRLSQRVLQDRITIAAAAYALRLMDEVAIGRDGIYANSSIAMQSRGMEMRADARLLDFVRSYVTYTFSKASDSTGETTAYGPPRHMASAGLLLHDTRTIGRLSARYLGTKTGILRHLGDEGLVRDALVLDFYVERLLRDQIAVFLQGANLLNLTYETFQGRPMMPRTVLLGISATQNL